MARKARMSSKTASLIGAMMICLNMPLAASAIAQSPSTPALQDEVNAHHMRIYQMMKEMTDEMTKMTDQMAQGAPTQEQQKQMAQRMAAMATMMRRLSGLEARPAIRHADMQKQLDQMQKQMDEMMRGSQAGTGSK